MEKVELTNWDLLQANTKAVISAVALVTEQHLILGTTQALLVKRIKGLFEPVHSCNGQ